MYKGVKKVFLWAFWFFKWLLYEKKLRILKLFFRILIRYVVRFIRFFIRFFGNLIKNLIKTLKNFIYFIFHEKDLVFFIENILKKAIALFLFIVGLSLSTCLIAFLFLMFGYSIVRFGLEKEIPFQDFCMYYVWYWSWSWCVLNIDLILNIRICFTMKKKWF